MVPVYCFSSENLTNVWAGYGARKWAVSEAQEREMRRRETTSLEMPIGAYGLIWCSAEDIKSFTMPFRVVSEPRWITEAHIWPEPWSMPFDIEPLGSPARRLTRADAGKLLDCLKEVRSMTDVFFVGGSCAFVPSKIPDEGWEIILEELCDYPKPTLQSQ